MPLTLDLKEATRTHHLQLEAGLRLTDPHLSGEDYLQVLTRFWGLYTPIEQQVVDCPSWQAFMPDYLRRVKTPRLRQDLNALGLSPSRIREIPMSLSVPSLNGLAQVFGAMYVLEGATLGGRIISRQLQERFGYDETYGAAFFTGYGEDTGTMWQRFCERLNALDLTPEERQQTIQTACDTFMAFDEWINHDTLQHATPSPSA